MKAWILLTLFTVNVSALDVEDLDHIKNAKDPLKQISFMAGEKHLEPYEYTQLGIIRQGYKSSKQEGEAIIECYKSLIRSQE